MHITGFHTRSKEQAVFHGDQGETLGPLGCGHNESKIYTSRDQAGVMGGPGVYSYVYDAMSAWTVYHFHDTSATAAVRRSTSARDYERLRPDGSNLAAFLLRLRETSKASYESIRETVQLVAPFFDDFKLRPDADDGDTNLILEWTQKGSDYPFHPSQLSDGTLRFMCLATALLQPDPPSTILLDEPELGMHPYAINVLAGLLHHAASRTQVIVSTQSTSLLDSVEVKDVVVVDRADHESKFSRLDDANLKDWLEEYTLGELWEKNVIGGRPEA